MIKFTKQSEERAYWIIFDSVFKEYQPLLDALEKERNLIHDEIYNIIHKRWFDLFNKTNKVNHE